MAFRSHCQLYKRGEIWWLDPDAYHDDPDNTIGEEIVKRRPYVVISSDAFLNQGVRLVVPFTSWQDKFEAMDFHFFVAANSNNNLRNDSSLNVLQTRCVSTLRFEEYIGRLSQSEMDEVAELLAFIIEVP